MVEAMDKKIAVVGCQSSRRFPKREYIREFRRKQTENADFSEVFLDKLHKSHPDESLKIKTKPL